MGVFIMRRVFIVVGHSGSRKSSAIRALTGVGQRKVFQVMQIDRTILNIYVHPASLQEDRIAPGDFIRLVENLDDNPDVLLALRSKASRNRQFPDAMEYALQFERAGWQIAGVAALQGASFDPLTPNAPPPVPISSSHAMPANEIASRIRGSWNLL
jgi:Tfp pilus assembly ATPase PilU